MNVPMQDAFNIGRKISSVIAGFSDLIMLETKEFWDRLRMFLCRVAVRYEPNRLISAWYMNLT